MTFDDVRAIALQWPEVVEGSSYGTPALKIRGKLLTRLKEDGVSLVIQGVEHDERALLIKMHPDIFYFTDHYRDWPIVLLRLPEAPREIIETFLQRRWRALASKTALASVASIRTKSTQK
jgi:hypothetical protein